MTRRILIVFGLVLLVIMAGVLGTATSERTTPESEVDGEGFTPTVTVSASGSVTMEPDLAIVYLSVEATADTADDARAQVAADVAAVRDELGDLGLADDAVTTASFQIHPEYEYTGETRELVGYRAVHALTVDADVDQAGAVIDAAVGAGAVRVSGVQFTLTDESHQAARERALGQAMANAGADAGAIADAADLTLDGVRSVSTDSPVVVPSEGRFAVAEDAAAGTSLEPGPVEITASVEVVYRVA